MASTMTTWLHEGARIAGAVTVVAGLAWPIAKPAAEQLVNQTVETKLKVLENKFDQIQSSNSQLATQSALNQQALETLTKQTDETHDDIKGLQADFRSLLRELRNH